MVHHKLIHTKDVFVDKNIYTNILPPKLLSHDKWCHLDQVTE